MKRIRTIFNLCRVLIPVFFVVSACHEGLEKEVSESEGHTFYLATRSGEPLTTPVSAYIFSENVLYFVAPGLSSPFSLAIPEGAKVFFFAGDSQPAGLAAVKKGETTLNDFQKIQTDDNSPHLRFYTGSLDYMPGNDTYKVDLSIGEARIDLDATSSSLLRIHTVKVSGISASTALFPDGNPNGPVSRTDTVRIFDPFVEGACEDILRLYESDTSLYFTVEGTYDGIPISFSASLPQVVRNNKYVLKVLNAGAEMTGVFEVQEMSEEIVTTGPHVDEELVVTPEHSILPDGTIVESSGQSLIVPHTGGDITLAFMAESEVDFESVLDELNNLHVDGTSVVRREGDKILTQFRIHVDGQGENTLPYTTTLNVKSILRNHATSRITLIVDAPPLYIREVTLGGVTWMAFNARSRDINDQVYPMKGYDVGEMYNREWLATLGGLFQHGRPYMYVPWESGVNNQGNQTGDLSWTVAANTPCPAGYRVPTIAELSRLFGTDDGGTIPGSWNYNGERITATEVTATNSQISINGVTGTAKYLKLTGARGGVMYIPYGGMKAYNDTSSKDPVFGKGFRLWADNVSVSSSDGIISALSIYCGFLGSTTTQKFMIVRNENREAYGYVRCIKE